ncbi:MAG: class I tRNA ligase family protein, partial [Acidobacteriota bacterium]|nr:class I tRNA ligase family protein [Acidobacteriota bacterium]
RNFCNKLWNASRFVQMNLGPEVTLTIEPDMNGDAEVWMAQQLLEKLPAVTKAIEEFRFHEAADLLYHLVWDDFCSTYIELAKVQLQSGTKAQKAAILHFLDLLLRALHPIVPFVTEEIHEAMMADRLPPGEPALLALRSWPDVAAMQQAGAPLFNHQRTTLIPAVQDAISAIRRLKQELGVDPNQRVQAKCTRRDLAPFAEAIKAMARVEPLDFEDGPLDLTAYKLAIITDGTLGIAQNIGQRDPAAEKAKLEKELAKLEKELEPLRARLADESFITKAPEAAVAKLRGQAEEREQRLAQVKALLG